MQQHLAGGVHRVDRDRRYSNPRDVRPLRQGEAERGALKVAPAQDLPALQRDDERGAIDLDAGDAVSPRGLAGADQPQQQRRGGRGEGEAANGSSIHGRILPGADGPPTRETRQSSRRVASAKRRIRTDKLITLS